MKLLLSTAYLPTAEYFSFIKAADLVLIEKCENYIKQSYRTRTLIASANGPQMLSFPVAQTHQKTIISDIAIDYAVPWQRNHWRSITAAYNNSPFFLYYQDYLYPFFEKRFKYLIDYNFEMLMVLMKLLGLNTPVKFSDEYVHSVSDDFIDLRYRLQPKLPFPDFGISVSEYPQVFSDREAFIPRLSVIDLLANVGASSASFFVCNR